ncbi:MAG: histidine kinase, partial [Bacteroidota bacterium]
HVIDSEYSAAFAAQKITLDIAKEANDSLLMGIALNGIGSALTFSQDSVLAEDYLNKALAISEASGDLMNQAAALHNLSINYRWRGKVDTAIQLITLANEVALAGDLRRIQAAIRLNSASFYNDKGAYERAIVVLDEVMGERASLQELDLAYVNFFYYDAYEGLGELRKAENYFDLACAILEELDMANGRKVCASRRARWAASKGDYRAAYDYHIAYHNIYVEQQGRESSRKINSLETALKLRAKDEEIAELNAAQAAQTQALRWRFNVIMGLLLVLVSAVTVAYFFLRVRHRARRAEDQQAAAEVKLRLLQSQMSPHFVFNAITGVQNSILRSDKFKAYEYLGKFADLLRTSTSFNDNFHLAFTEEMRFIRYYLELEKLRFRDSFTYAINLAPNLEKCSLHVPGMIIQPIIEHAIKHGIGGHNGHGHVTVDCIPMNGVGVKCTITDNGQGRAAAAVSKGNNNHLSIATNNIQQRIEFLHKLGYEQVELAIEDLYRNNEPAGTRVTLHLPFLTEDNVVLELDAG